MSHTSFRSVDAHRHTVATRPLLVLRDATAESRAGLAPHCAATVRLLDRVFFSVGAGECVLVQHRDPAGVRVLLAALAGTQPQLATALRGTRVVRPGVRVRRASIRADLVPTLMAAWQAPTSISAPQAVPTVHLLRASRRDASESHSHQAWSRWAAALHASGGALVIVADADDGMVPRRAPVPVPTVAPSVPTEVHEPAHVYASDPNEKARPGLPVRAYRWRHGRVVAASARAVAEGYWPSEAPEVLGP